MNDQRITEIGGTGREARRKEKEEEEMDIECDRS
jgi:hypothetical protein